MTTRSDADDRDFLDDLRIAKPCTADWSEMRGDDRSRFCAHCEKNVYDLRFMTRAEAEALLRAKGEACVRMARRADGTVITSDCPVGVKSAARRQRVVGVAAGGLLAASALLSKVRGAEAQEAKPRPAPVQVEEHHSTGDVLFGWVDVLLRIFMPPPPPPVAPPEPMMMGEVAMPEPPPPPPPVRMGKIAPTPKKK